MNSAVATTQGNHLFTFRVVAREVALSCDDPEAAFAAGRLTAGGAEQEAALLAEAQGAYVSFAEAKRFW